MADPARRRSPHPALSSRLLWSTRLLSQALNGENTGLEQVQDGVWNILYYDTLLGRFDERSKAITGAPSIRGQC